MSPVMSEWTKLKNQSKKAHHKKKQSRAGFQLRFGDFDQLNNSVENNTPEIKKDKYKRRTIPGGVTNRNTRS